jgi:outer membrane protein assembly factor BamB
VQALRETDPRRIGPYEVLGRLGAGGMGEVYLAASRAGLRLAVKVVRTEHAEDRTFRARFRQEVRAAQTVGGTGTYTARVVDADTEGERPWMATEFVDGPNLRDAVLDHGPLPEDAVRTLAAALGEALAAIHAKGLVHRDLKPSNILLAPDGPRVIDFGIVRALEATALTRTGAVVGSVGYVSPEQIRNGAEVGPPSDVFSLGAVLAYASSGREPFGEGQDSVILLRVLTRDFDLTGLPQAVLPLVESCLRAEPEERPTPQDVVAAAGHTGRSLGQSARPGWFTTAPKPPEGDQRWLPERESQERGSRVEYVAPVTLTHAPAPADTPVPASRRGALRFLAGGAVAAAGAGAGGWWWLRDRGAEGGRSTADGPGSGAATPTVARQSTGAGWQYETGGLGGRHGACVVPSSDGGRLYVGGADGALHAVSPDGKKLWRTRLSGSPVMPPLVTADGAYCLTEDDGEGAAELYAVGPGGRVRWKRTINGGGSQFPVAAGGLVLVTTGTANSGSVRAYTSDGRVGWETPTPGGPTSEPAVAGGTAYVGTFADAVVALDVKDGRRSWAVQAGIDTGRPTPVGDTLVVGSGGEYSLHGVSTSGRRRWQRRSDEVGGSRYFTSVRLGDLVVTSASGTVVALDPADGSTAWTFSSRSDAQAYSDPTVVANTVHVCLGSRLYALDRRGKQLWKASFDGAEGASTHRPVIRGKRAYLATNRGIAALDISE